MSARYYAASQLCAEEGNTIGFRHSFYWSTATGTGTVAGDQTSVRVYMMRVRHMRMRVRLRSMNVRMRMSSARRHRAVVWVIMVIVLGTMHVAVRV